MVFIDLAEVERGMAESSADCIGDIVIYNTEHVNHFDAAWAQCGDEAKRLRVSLVTTD